MRVLLYLLFFLIAIQGLAYPDWYLEITESDTNYEAYTEVIRRVNAEFSFPNKGTKTQRLSVRRVKSATPSSMLVFEETARPSIDSALTAGELSALTQTDPGGYVLSPVEDNEDPYNIEASYDCVRHIATDGDSIISWASSPWTLDLADRVYSQVYTKLGSLSTDDVDNIGVGGKKLIDLDDDVVTKYNDLNFPSSCTPYYVIMGGTNDITHDGKTAQQAMDTLNGLIDSVQTAHPSANIIVVTPIARLATVEPTATLQSFRTLIINNASAEDYTVADAGGLSMFDEASDTSNTTYYQTDKEHPTATGAGEIAEVIKDAIEAL